MKRRPICSAFDITKALRQGVIDSFEALNQTGSGRCRKGEKAILYLGMLLAVIAAKEKMTMMMTIVGRNAPETKGTDGVEVGERRVSYEGFGGVDELACFDSPSSEDAPTS